MKRFLLVGLLALLPTLASAQCNGVFPAQTVCGNPDATGKLPRAMSPSGFIGAAGGVNGEIQYNSGGTLAGATGGDVAMSGDATLIQPNAVTNSKINSGAANTMKGSLNGTNTTDISLTACTLTYQITKWVAGSGWQCGINPVLPSRAVAATLDLSAFTAITTQGYATPGDGGGATFVNVGSTPFQDSFVTGGSITNAGAACTNGTYLVHNLVGGTGVGLQANITVAGNIVTAVTIVNGGGNGYTVGDTTTNSAVGCANWVWTVSTVSTPLASFTDSAGNHWQYVPTPLISVRQFGAKADWAGTDGTATNDFAAIDAAIRFASRITSGARLDQGGADSSTVYLARGASLVCNPLTVYRSTKLVGSGPFNSSMKICDSGVAATAHFVTLGDPNTQSACFGPALRDMTLYSTTAAVANTNVGMIFSNCAQQTLMLERVAVYAGMRNCLRYTNGYGGAAKITSIDFFCTLFSASSNDGLSLDPTTTVNMEFISLIIEAGGAGYAGNGINWRSGNLFVWGYHTEQVATGLNAENATATHQGSLHGATGGNLCTELVKLQATNTLGNLVIGTSQVNGCTRLITNGQPGGANFAGPTVKDITCNPGAPCN